MAFWKIYKKTGDDYDQKEEVKVVDKEKGIHTFLKSLDNVKTILYRKSWGFNHWATYDVKGELINRYITIQYKPTKEELKVLRPKKKVKKLSNKKINIKSGDLFNTSWGYDQTQYNFLVIKSVSPTGKTVKCKMVRINIGDNIGAHDIITPTKEEFGNEFRLRVQEYQTPEGVVKYDLRGSYPFLRDGIIENGSRMDWFNPYDENREYTQTNIYHTR